MPSSGCPVACLIAPQSMKTDTAIERATKVKLDSKSTPAERMLAQTIIILGNDVRALWHEVERSRTSERSLRNEQVSMRDSYARRK